MSFKKVFKDVFENSVKETVLKENLNEMGGNKFLSPKWTMEKLLQKMKEIEEDPNNKNPEHEKGNSIYIYKKEARKKLDEISWAITYLLGEKKKERERK